MSQRDPLSPRQRDLLDFTVEPDRLAPQDELELAEAGVLLAAADEEKRCFDPECHPKAPHPREEPVTSRDGSRVVDIQRDTTRVDDLAKFDLSPGELRDVDVL
jgi:hypothetical protein